VTPLPPFLPEKSGALVSPTPASGPAIPQAVVPPGSGLDFADLLGAAQPAAAAAAATATPYLTFDGMGVRVPEHGGPAFSVPGTTLTGDAAADVADPATLPVLPSVPLAHPMTIAAPANSLPGGRILPEPGAQLPPPASSPVLLSQQPDIARALPVRPQAAFSHAPLPGRDHLASVPLKEDATDGRVSAFASPADPPIAEPVHPSPALAGTPAHLDAEAGTPATDPAPSEGLVAEPPAGDRALAATLLAATQPAPAPAHTPPAAVALSGPRATLPVRRGDASLPLGDAAPKALSDDASPAGLATASSAPSQTTPASNAPPDLLASAPQPVPAIGPAPVASAAIADRIEAPRAPAPQMESSIAQVETLREAARTGRPELTLRHAEFGAVSLRLEAAGTEGWRAVLASRDPGFVPAIQAALADRAVAAAASASTDSGAFSGQNTGQSSGQNTGQNGTSDQRYAASPNGGQAGSQPYLGHSAHRDGEAAPDHRRPSTAAALAARAEEGEEAAGSPARQTRGMFA